MQTLSSPLSRLASSFPDHPSPGGPADRSIAVRSVRTPTSPLGGREPARTMRSPIPKQPPSRCTCDRQPAPPVRGNALAPTAPTHKGCAACGAAVWRIGCTLPSAPQRGEQKGSRRSVAECPPTEPAGVMRIPLCRRGEGGITLRPAMGHDEEEERRKERERDTVRSFFAMFPIELTSSTIHPATS